MSARIVVVQLFTVVALVAGSAGVAGCAGVEVSPIDTTLAAGVDDPEALFTSVLAAHVHDGHVDYEALVDDTDLDTYIAWLARTDPSSLDSRDERLAFWINAYNAYTLKLIRDNYPVESINDLHSGGRIIAHVTGRTAWDRSFAVVGGNTYTLNHIEHEIVRPRFKDPRVHFALVCAAVSCPPLRAEAYSGSRLNAQLDEQGRVFFSEADKNNFDPINRVARLSKILDWYGGDFGDGDAEVLLAIAPYLNDDVRADIESNPSEWRIEFTDYDWSLNR